ncbi:alpha-galactosidase [Paenibacillus rhizosphaerae]|uniref:Alpha-galactosidase n=1 Tax=Paenibacillus rhizosphaerae TaxID=297318 RepID=A0A839TPE8_9BACL|nr:alpha-galactosidase [Paenibacillus rhizosphaerae]MBB3128844.1 alpha-galactosidase [Paenibacillus rhizosphaerae]
MIHYLEHRRTWIIETDQAAYGLGLTETGQLIHLYFGESLPYHTDYPEPRDQHGWASFNSRADRNPEEYTGWGGVRYSEPCLKVEFHDHVRDLVLVYKEYVIQDGALVITLRDAHYPLEIRLNYKPFAELNLIQRTAEIVNTGEHPVDLEQVLSGELHLPAENHYRLSYLSGKWAGETQLRQIEMPDAKFILESRGGTTSHQTNPWFAMDPDGCSTEDYGKVFFGALAYSGNWKMVFEKRFGKIKASAGVHDFDFRWRLNAGETFAAPAFTIGYSAEGFGGASRQLHQYQLEYVLPRQTVRQDRKVLYNSWEATRFDVNEQDQIRLAELAATLGVELFVMDDGWFGRRNDDHAGLGDWTVNPEKFPNGLRPLIERVEELGMEFGIWVEPEMVNPDSDLYRRHPDWVYHFPNRVNSEMRNQLVLNLAREDVKQYLIGCLDRLLTENRIRFVKWDMNRLFSEPGYLDAPYEQQREIWVRHVRSLYDIVETLRKNHPDVHFQSCSGGGGRVDLGILELFDQVWVSDNTDAYDRLFIQEGYSYAYCAKTMESWVTAEQHWMNNRRLPLRFRFHVAMTGVLGIGENLHAWSEKEREEARGYVEAYKKVRSGIQNGRQYRLQSPKNNPVSSVMYVSEQQDTAVVFAFLYGNRNGDELRPLRLKGLDETKYYVLEGTEQRRSGKAWMSVGIELELKGDLDSCMLVLRADPSPNQ